MSGFKSDGGPAFPLPDIITASESLWCSGHPGMSLRDWFAGQAINGFLSQSHGGPKDWTHIGFGWGEDCANSLNKGEEFVAATLAAFAYRVADAMLAESAKSGGGE